MSYLLSFAAGILFVELTGYWLHILLHSEKLPSLSRAHMLHHLRDYGHPTPLHRDTYVSSAASRGNILGTGMEWMAPILLILAATLLTMHALKISFAHQSVFIGTGLSWGYFLFGYMHSTMHLKKFWMHKIPVLNSWHKNARRLHDLHHTQISQDGRMQKNYGICFFWFDRLFGTYSPKTQAFSRAGYAAAMERYKDILA